MEVLVMGDRIRTRAVTVVCMYAPRDICYLVPNLVLAQVCIGKTCSRTKPKVESKLGRDFTYYWKPSAETISVQKYRFVEPMDT
jgi:hypothetical protein